MKRFTFSIILLAAAFALLDQCRAAEHSVISEFGVAYKTPSLTSQVMWPQCSVVIITDQALPRGVGNSASCGGDNPAFIGWIAAYEWEGADEVWRVRAGLFHVSHWFDGGNVFHGGDTHELFGTWPAVTATFNWTKWARNR